MRKFRGIWEGAPSQIPLNKNIKEFIKKHLTNRKKEGGTKQNIYWIKTNNL